MKFLKRATHSLIQQRLLLKGNRKTEVEEMDWTALQVQISRKQVYVEATGSNMSVLEVYRLWDRKGYVPNVWFPESHFAFA